MISNRQNLFSLIKKYNLQSSIKDKYGSPYSNLPTNTLAFIITEYEQKEKASSVKIENKKEEKNEERNEEMYKDKFDKLISLLAKKHILLNSEIQEIYNK